MTLRNRLRGSVNKPLIFHGHCIHVGGRNAEIGYQHEAGTAINRNVDDASSLTRSLTQLVQGIAKPLRGKYRIFFVTHRLKPDTDKHAAAQ